MSSDTQEGRVGVNIRCAIRLDPEDNAFVAHFLGLGLIARGQTEEEAIGRSKRLFNKFVHNYRSVGQLKMRLDQAGVEWWWLDHAPANAPEPEDTDLLPPILRTVSTLPEISHLRNAMEEAQQQEMEGRSYAVAA